MPLDPNLVAETRVSFEKVAEDLRATDFEFGAAPPLLSDIVFHSQQAAEKAMKGFLTWHGQTFRRTHCLEEIGEQCLTINALLESLVDRAARLSQYVWRYRYPGPSPEPPVAEA